LGDKLAVALTAPFGHHNPVMAFPAYRALQFYLSMGNYSRFGAAFGGLLESPDR
jgi:hypothetical protein